MYASKSSAAREGMRMLIEQGVEMRSMTTADWEFIVGCCDPSVVEAFAQRGQPTSPFSRLHLALRSRMDSYLSDYISEWKSDRSAEEEAAYHAETWDRYGDCYGDGGAARAGAAGGGEAWDGPRRLVRLSLGTLPSGCSARLAADPAGDSSVRLTLSWQPAHHHVTATLQPVRRFHRDGVSAGAAAAAAAVTGSAAGAIGVAGVGGTEAAAGAAAEGSGGVEERASCLTPVEGRIVATSGTTVKLRIRVHQPSALLASSAAGGSSAQALADAAREAALADTLGMGYQYAKGPDGTRGFRLVRKAAAAGISSAS